jgi:hypothetical protein
VDGICTPEEEMKIFKSPEELPSQVTYRDHVYKRGPSYGNGENAGRKARELRTHGFAVLTRKFYVQMSRPYTYYILYVRMVK